MQYLFRSRHYNRKAYGERRRMVQEMPPREFKTFAWHSSVDPPFWPSALLRRHCFMTWKRCEAGRRLILEYLPWEVALDIISNEPYEDSRSPWRSTVDVWARKDGKLMENDIVLYRYADVLLMKIEAKSHNRERWWKLNFRVRSRVAAPGKLLEYTFLNERQLEFAWEGWRRQDLAWGLDYSPVRIAMPYSWLAKRGEYSTVFPIPR